MLALFRRFASTWAARLFFLLLIASFGAWGIADIVRNMGASPDTVATIGDQKISVGELGGAYRRQLQQVSRMFPDPSQIPPEMRRSLLAQSLGRLEIQAAIAAEAKRLRLVAPDEAVREAVYAIPAFQGPNGQFDRATFNAAIANAGLTEQRFLELMRADLKQQQVLESLRAGIGAPSVLVRRVFDLQAEKRVAETVDLPFASVPVPAAPREAKLLRYYENNPDTYTAPEYRRIKLIVLSPDTVARTLAVPEADLRAAYEQHKAAYQTPEKRSIQVITAPDEAQARQLAALWQGGADWPAIQAAAAKAGASTAALDDATRETVPSPELAAATFAATAGSVTGPVHEPLGWQVLRVTHVTPATSTSFEQARESLRQSLAREKALDLVDQRAQKLQDLLAGGATLDEVPVDLGAAAVEGSLDAKGQTPDGIPAPLPVPQAARQAVIDAAFKTKPGAPARLTEGPEQSWYALAVEEVTPTHLLPFDQVRDRVLADWQRDTVRHTQDQAAAALLVAARHGQGLRAAAIAAHMNVWRSEPFDRAHPAPGLPENLARILFSLKQGEVTMTESPTGFTVGTVAEIRHPDPKDDPETYARVQTGMNGSLANDAEITFATALRERAKPQENQQALDSLLQP